jgi:hypothetical protein
MEIDLDYVMDVDYSVEYYTQRLNEKRETGKLLGIIRIPNGRPYQFVISTLLVFSILDFMIGGSYFILPLVGILLCFSYYFKFKLREVIIDQCIMDEAFMDYEAKKFDEEDIDDEDRIGIFHYNYGMKGYRTTLFQSLKSYYKELSLITALGIALGILI